MTPVSLPSADEAPRCADFARDNLIDPGGTSLAPDVILLVEVPEPWPKPAAKHPDLVDAVVAAQHAAEQVRVLAAVPHDSSRPRIVSFRPTPGGMLRSEVAIGQSAAADVAHVLAENNGELVTGRAQLTMLVCTQGSHDVCCGTLGNEFAEELEQLRPDVEIFRVSHTGGHRFSPTAMSLPDGRMWAFLDADAAVGILDRTLDPVAAASRCRGWWGVPTGPAQVAERAVFAELGWPVDDQARTATVDQADGTHVVSVAGAEFEASVVVAVGREVPTIACEQPGGEPVKPGREWQVRSIEIKQ